MLISLIAFQCLVCLDDYEPEQELRVMKCRHAFHKECVDKWLTVGRNNCPACRTKVRSISLLNEALYSFLLLGSQCTRRHTTPLVRAGSRMTSKMHLFAFLFPVCISFHTVLPLNGHLPTAPALLPFGLASLALFRFPLSCLFYAIVKLHLIRV